MNQRIACVRVCLALSLTFALLGTGKATAQQPGIIVIEQVEPLPPAPLPPPQAPQAPEPPAQYGAQPGPYPSPNGMTWVPVPRGYRVVLEPINQPRLAPLADQPRAHGDPYLDYGIERAVRRARRSGFIQLASTAISLIGIAGGMSCSFGGSYYCDGWWSTAIAGFLSFSTAGIVSAFSANRASRLLEDSGVPIRRGAGRFAIALSFVPYVNIGAFVMTTVQLGRVRRARAQRRPAAPPMYTPPPMYTTQPMYAP